MAVLHAAGASYRVDGILFDKDGTLLDFIYTWGNWSERLLARFSASLKERSLPPIRADLDELWGANRSEDGGPVVDYDRNGPLAMGTVDEMLAILAWHGYRSGLSWAEAKTLAAEAKLAADERLEATRAARLLPGVLDFLEDCRQAGVPLAVVTADETEAALKHLTWLGIRERFDAIVGTDLVERGKPYPDMALLACERLGLGSGRFAVVGDTTGDMRMAKEAGAAAAILIAEPGSSADRSDGNGADAVVATLQELSITKEDSRT
ncbi:phosphoglycolate phosphatase [Cohnella sp. OV330]|uniref:HAD family hydrolase n=1 Tax=Cohnella sp. OV330 TaxID=1855288 RepID=UPI0008E9B445|nr:HAD-IA family hydrolase [Cohnella sp. OV330]SFB51907.1 phosphoglycolate phosphatase [Cohnella sp. OV330]